MKIRKEIISMNSELGSGLIKKNNASKMQKSPSNNVSKSKSDGIARWEEGGKIIKADGSLATCKLIHKVDEHGLES